MAPRRASEVRKEADLDFERLYAGHRGDVFRAALRELGNVHDAEDVTQAAFIDAYRAVLRGSRPEAPRAWLLAIAENVRRRRFRAALRRPREAPLDPEAALAAEPTTEQTNALRIALTALPPQQRVVFLLREIVGLSYDEIAEELGSTVGAVQMLLFRARKALRSELEPPAVTQRGGIIVPLPGWLTGLATRTDALVLTPRAAGALGAAVLAVTGVTAGLAESPQHAAAPRAVSSTAPVVHARKPARTTRRCARGKACRRACARRPAKPRPGAVSTAFKPQRTPVVAPTPAAPAVPAQRTEARQVPAVTAQTRRLPPLPAVEVAAVEVTTAVAAQVVTTAVTAAPRIPPPETPATCVLAAALLLEQAGAAAVAGADRPPLPALPLDTLPPVP